MAAAMAHVNATLPYPPPAGLNGGPDAHWANGGLESLAGWSPPPSYDHTNEWEGGDKRGEKRISEEASPRPSQVGLAF